MDIAVVYESMFGNTHAVAEAIAGRHPGGGSGGPRDRGRGGRHTAS